MLVQQQRQNKTTTKKGIFLSLGPNSSSDASITLSSGSQLYKGVVKGQIRKQHLTYNTEIWATREENTPRTCTGIPVYKHYFKDHVNHMLPTVHIKITMLKRYWGKKKTKKPKPTLPVETSKTKTKLLVTGYIYSEAKQGSHYSCL